MVISAIYTIFDQLSAFTIYVHADLFDEAQEWVLNKMEKDIHPKFLCSSDGQKYLEALVDRDITRRKKNRYMNPQLQSCTFTSIM